MLKSESNIEHLIQKIIFLLKKSDCIEWIPVFKELLQDCNSSTKDKVARKIISLYGGMGTFNDLTLYKGSEPLLEENDELDQLSEELYQACNAYVTRDEEGNIIE